MVQSAYLRLYGNNLNEKLCEEIDGHFLETVLALFKDPFEYEAEWIKNASEDKDEDVNEDVFLADEKTMIEVFCSREASEIKNLNQAFIKRILTLNKYKNNSPINKKLTILVYDKKLDSVIGKDFKGNLGRILRSIVAGERAENKGFSKHNFFS